MFKYGQMLILEYKPYQLDFKFVAGTSRGKMTSHHLFILKVSDQSQPLVNGYGEVAPLRGLSPESMDEVKNKLEELKTHLHHAVIPQSYEDIIQLVNEMVESHYPSIRFGLQTALLDLMNGGKRILFDTPFIRGSKHIPINGLIWMGEESFMKEQIDEKLEKGFTCVKLKIGAIDFEVECRLLEYLRNRSKELIIRVDANGSFPVNEALAKLNTLGDFDLHSIEQPIMPRQPEALQLICKKSPVPIALDEELIGLYSMEEKKELISFVKPSFLVLKPTLIGGFKSTSEWISLAEQFGIGWWITSALESNIGLNAIAQYTATLPINMHQGLGTGQLYHNNIQSPLEMNETGLHYVLSKQWKLPVI